MPTKRAILAALTRDELRANVDCFELNVDDRRIKAQLVDALVRYRRARLDWILQDLPRNRLKDLCRAFHLDDVGRKKADLVVRLVGRRAASMGADGAMAAQKRDEIQVLTVRQPWAALIAAGVKCTENRKWVPNTLPKVIAIHAAHKVPTPSEIVEDRSRAKSDPHIDWQAACKVFAESDKWAYGRLVCLASLREPYRDSCQWRWPITGVYRVGSQDIRGQQGLFWVPVERIMIGAAEGVPDGDQVSVGHT